MLLYRLREVYVQNRCPSNTGNNLFGGGHKFKSKCGCKEHVERPKDFLQTVFSSLENNMKQRKMKYF